MEDDRRSSSMVRFALGLVQRLLDGDVLTAREAAVGAPAKAAAVRRVLQDIEEYIDGVSGFGKRNRKFQFIWPDFRTVDRWKYVSLVFTRELTSLLHDSHLDNMLKEVISDHRHRLADMTISREDMSRIFFSKSRAMFSHGLDSDTIDTVIECILERKCLSARYTHFSGKNHEITLEPYSLVFGDEGLYLIAKCVDCDEPKYILQRRVLNVARIINARKSDQEYAYPSGTEYTGRHELEHCFGVFMPEDEEEPVQVKIKFKPHWKAYLTVHRWHEKQSAPAQDENGELEVMFELFITGDLVRWVRGFGKEITSIEPKRLREWVVNGADPWHPERWG